VSSNVSFSDSDSTIASDDEGDITAYFENDDRAAFCGSGIIAMAMVSTSFFAEGISPEIISDGLRNVGTLSMLLCDDNEQMTKSSQPLVAKVTDQDLIFPCKFWRICMTKGVK
jgi:hypothetical protein